MKFLRYMLLMAISLLIFGCHNSSKNLIDDNNLIMPFPDEFVVYKNNPLFSDKENILYVVKRGKVYSVNKGEFEFKVSKLKSGFFWVQREYKKMNKKGDPLLEKFQHFAIQIKDRELLYYSSVNPEKVAATTDGMIKLLEDDIKNPAGVEKYRLFNFKIPTERTEAIKLLRNAYKKESTISATPGNNNKWVFKQEKDPIDETLKQYLFGYPQGFPKGSGGPYIRIGCYDNQGT